MYVFMSVSEKKYKNIRCQKDEAIHVDCYEHYDFVFYDIATI